MNRNRKTKYNKNFQLQMFVFIQNKIENFLGSAKYKINMVKKSGI